MGSAARQDGMPTATSPLSVCACAKKQAHTDALNVGVAWGHGSLKSTRVARQISADDGHFNDRLYYWHSIIKSCSDIR